MALTLKNNDTNELNTKRNHWRQRAMQLLHALGLEKMMGLRMKSMAKVYIPTKEQKTLEILSNAKAPEETVPEMNRLNDLLGFLRQAANHLMQNVSQSLQQALVNAQQPQQGQQQPRLSTLAAFNLRSAVSAAFTPSLNADVFRTTVSQRASQFANHASRQQLDILSVVINGASSSSASFGLEFDNALLTTDTYSSSKF